MRTSGVSLSLGAEYLSVSNTYQHMVLLILFGYLIIVDGGARVIDLRLERTSDFSVYHLHMLLAGWTPL